PYISWATAARTIQEGIDGAFPGSTIIVTNDTYATGGRALFDGLFGLVTNRGMVTKPVILRSANGPEVTCIRGRLGNDLYDASSAIRCVYLTNDAKLIGFTLTNGGTHGYGANDYLEQSGGGVWSESGNTIVSNCIIAGNLAYGYGGGAFNVHLINCLIV